MAEKKKEERLEISSTEEKTDFFKVEKRDPNFHYHWGENTPRRVQEMKRQGYEIDPASSGRAAKEKVEKSKEFLKRQLNSSDTMKEDKMVAKELLDRMDSSPSDTTVNIPGHILMRTPVENRRRRQEGKMQRSKMMEDRIQADIQSLNKALE